MVAVVQEPGQRLLLYSVPWNAYDAILRALDGRHLRISYDRGSLEIMTLSLEHEFFKTLLGRLIELMTYEMNISMFPGGSTTFKRMMLEKGLEPDECYWIQNERAMRGKKEFDIDVDPPPDLVVEVDITSSSINRMGIYASLRVPEVWRFDGETLEVHVLGANGKYRIKQQSRAFPFLPMAELVRFLTSNDTEDQTVLMHRFGKWVRATLVPAAIQAGKGDKKNGKKPGA